MRSVPAILSLSLLCMAPCIAHAQERGGDARADARADDVVDLQGIQSAASTESRRSAFGRVMDVMIAKLIEQEMMPVRARNASHPVAIALDSAPSRAAKDDGKPPRIDIAIGERFALPPAESLSSASVPE